VSDFISGLRSDLVEAAARDQHHGALARATRPLHPRAWTGGLALGAAAVAAGVAAFVLAVIALAPRPAERAARPTVVATFHIGGQPNGAAFGAGALWIADFEGRLVEVDPSRRRIVRRVELSDSAEAVGVGGSDVWVRLSVRDAGAVLRVDAPSGHVTGRVPVGDGEGIAVGTRAVWVTRRFNTAEGIDEIDRARARVVRRIGIRNADGAVEAGGRLWVAVQEGTIVEVDAVTGRVIRRWPALAPSRGAPGGGLVADARGLWVVSSSRGEILRIEDGRVVRRIPVTLTSRLQPLLARTGSGLWLAAGAAETSFKPPPNVLQRLDPRSGRVTGRVTLGRQQPVALVPVRGDLVVVTAQGRVIVVRG
jgi:hypothetical protein